MLLRTNNQQGAAGKSYGDVPVLNLDFTQGSLDPRLTFTSTGTGTIIDSSGTLNYAPHNLVPNSAPIGAVSPWTRTSVSFTQNANISPIGTQTATFCQYAQASDGKRINVNISTPSPRFTWSFYAKMIDGPGVSAIMYNATKLVQINPLGGDQARWTWNGTSFSNPLGSQRASATLVPNSDGWWRLSWSIESVRADQFSPNDVLSFYIYGDERTGSNTAGSNVSLWGGQVNLGTNLLPYVDTQSTAVFSPRFDYDPSTTPATSNGLLIEEQATNLVRNSLMNAASNIAGTTSINSGRGTIPDFHTFSTAVGGITGNVALVGTDSGLTFCDYRLYGTPSSTGNVLIQFDSGMTARSSNVTINSCYLRLSGLTTGVTPRLGLQWSNAAGFVGNTNQNITIGSGSLITQRTQNTYTLPATPTDISSANSYVLLEVTSGTPIDLFLRVAAPQFEVLTQSHSGRGASSFIPTSTSSVTRSADRVNSYSTGFSSWFNNTQGTFVTSSSTKVEPQGYATVIGVAPIGSVNGTDSIEVYHLGGGNQARFNFDIGGTTTWAANPVPARNVSNNSVKLAASYSPTLRAFAANSPAGNGFVANTTPATYRAMGYAYIGSRNNDLFLNGTIKSLKYYRKALSNSAIQTLANTAY